jgi:hypothetical protein
VGPTPLGTAISGGFSYRSSQKASSSSCILKTKPKASIQPCDSIPLLQRSPHPSLAASQSCAASLIFSNKLIFHDEGLHWAFAYILCNLLRVKLDKSCVHDIVADAIKIEREFITGEDPLGLISLSDASRRVPIAHAPNAGRPPPSHNR